MNRKKINKMIVTAIVVLLVFATAVTVDAKRVIVVLKDQPQGASLQQIKSEVLIKQQNIMSVIKHYKSQGKVKNVKQLWIVNAIAIDAEPDVIEELKKRSDVKEIIPDYKVRLLDSLPIYKPLDQTINQTIEYIEPSTKLWNLEMIKAPQVWATGINGSGIKVAVLDTGINANHIEFKRGSGTKIIAWKDFINNQTTPYDDNGHGTHVAGIIAGNTVGVAPGVDLIVAKVFDQYGYSNLSTIIGGFQWAVEQGADIISYSAGAIGFGWLENYTWLEAKDSYTINISVVPYMYEQAFRPAFIWIGARSYSDWVTDLEFEMKDPNGNIVSTNITGLYTPNMKVAKYMFDEPLVSGNWSLTIKSNLTDNWVWVSQGSGELVGSFDLTNVTNATLKFNYRFNTLDVYVSTDGTNWTNVFSGKAYSWDTGVVDLSSYCGNRILIKFVAPYEWTMLDNIEIPEIGFVDKNGNTTFWNATNWVVMDYPRDITVEAIVVYASDGTDLLSRTVENIVKNGTVVVAAAGNEGSLGLRTIASPACAKDVIAVGAVDGWGLITWFSSKGPVGWGLNETIKPDVVAPGLGVLSAYYGSNDEYCYMSGTSMATPHVSGVIALMLQKNSSLTPNQIKEIIEKTAVDGGAEGKDNVYGAGLIDAFACVENVTAVPPLIKLFGGTFKDVYWINETVKLFALEWNGSPVAGENITFEVWEWGWWYSNTPIFTANVTTDENGVAMVEFTPNESSDYMVTIKDEHGNTVETWFYVNDPTYHKWRTNYKWFTLKPNETVKMLWTITDFNGTPVNGNATLITYYWDSYGYWHDEQINVSIVDGKLEYSFNATGVSYGWISLNYNGLTRLIGGVYVTEGYSAHVAPEGWVEALPNETLKFFASTFNYDYKPVNATLTVYEFWFSPYTLSNIASTDEELARKIINKVLDYGDVKKIMSLTEAETTIKTTIYDVKNGYAVVKTTVPKDAVCGYIWFEFNINGHQISYYAWVDVARPSIVLPPPPTPPILPPATPRTYYIIDAWTYWGGHDDGKDYVPNETANVYLKVWKVNYSENVTSIQYIPEPYYPYSKVGLEPAPNVEVYVYARDQVMRVVTDENGLATVKVNVTYDRTKHRWDNCQYGIAVMNNTYSLIWFYPPMAHSIVEWTIDGNVLNYTIKNYAWEYNGNYWSRNPVNRTLITEISKMRGGCYEEVYTSEYWSGLEKHGFLNVTIGKYELEGYTPIFDWSSPYALIVNAPIDVNIPQYVVSGSNLSVDAKIDSKGVVYIWMYWWQYDEENDTWRKFSKLYVAETDDNGNAILNITIPYSVYDYLWVGYEIGFVSSNYAFTPAKHGYMIVQRSPKPDLTAEIDLPKYVKKLADGSVVLNGKILVKNLGTEVNNTFVVNVSFLGESWSYIINDTQLEKLNSERSIELEVCRTIDASEYELGCYLFNVTVDANDDVDEANEYNNFVQKTICLDRPNLVPVIITPKDVLMVDSATLEFEVGVENLAHVAANATKLRLIVANESYEFINETIDVPSIAGMASWLTSRNLTVTSEGVYNITVIVNCELSEIESNYTDNALTKSVSVETPAVTLKIGSDEVRRLDTCGIPITMKAKESVGAVQLNITYDPKILKLERVVGVNGTLEYNVSDGLVTIGIIDADGLSNGTLAYLVFRGIEAGISEINASIVDLTNVDGSIRLQGIVIGGKVTVHQRMIGDVNEDGNITATDALIYLRYAVGKNVSFVIVPELDDVTGDDRITAGDALKVLRKAVGQDVDLGEWTGVTCNA